MDDKIKVTKVTYDKGYENKDPIILSGEGLTASPFENGRDFAIWADMEDGGKMRLFKTYRGFSPKETQYSDEGELDLEVLVTGIVQSGVSSCKNISLNKGSMLFYQIESLPDFLFDYADIYAERLSENSGNPTSFKKMLLKEYQKEMAHLFVSLKNSEERETLLSKVKYDVNELSNFFAKREEKKREGIAQLEEFNSIFEEVLND